MATNEIHNVRLVLKVEGEADLMRLVKAVNDQNAILKSSAAQFERNSLSMRGFGRSALEAAASFQKGSGGISAWTDSLNRNKAGVASWVAAMGNVDSVNRKFASSLQGSSGGISNWVNELGKVNNGVSNWVRAMGQIGSSATQAATTLAQVKSELSSWNTSMLAGGKASGDWVARMGAVDAANRSATQGFKTGTYVVRDMAAAMGKSASYVEIMAKAEQKAAVESRRLTGTFSGGGHVIRNASSQFQDFAVQVQGGQDAMRAFAQQAPQLLSAFGTFGTVFGTIIAITIALPALKAAWDALMGSMDPDRVKPWDDALKDANKSIDDIGKTVDKLNFDKFVEEFNKADAATRKNMTSLLEWQMEVAKINTEQAAKSATQQLQELTKPGILDKIKAVWNADSTASMRSPTGQWDEDVIAIRQLAEQLGVTEQMAGQTFTQLRHFQKLTEEGQRALILQLERTNNVSFDPLIKSLNEIREQQLKSAQASKDSAEQLKKAKDAVATGSSLDADKPGKKVPEIIFDNEQLAKSEAIINRLQKSLSLTREQAAGIAGNLFVESQGFKSNIREINPATASARRQGGGFGLAQWTGTRQEELKRFAASVGKDMSDFDTQIDFLAKELQSNVTGRDALTHLRNTSGFKDAAKVIQDRFEIPAPQFAHFERRAAAAEAAFLGGQTLSERQNAIKAQEKLFKEQEAAEKKHQEVLASIRVDQSGKGLSDVQQKIAEARMQAYKQEGIDLDNLTEAMKRNKAEIDAAVQAKFMGIEVDKLQQRQTELAKKALEDMNDVLSGSVDIDIYNSKLADLQDALKGGAISTQDFIMWTGKLTEEYNKANDPIKQYTASLLQQQDALADIPQRIAAVQELMSKGLLNEKVGEDEILNLRQMTGEMDSLGSRTVDFFEGQLSGSINTFVDAIHGAKFSFKDFVDNMVKDITKFLLQEQLTAWMKSLRAGGAAGDAQSWWETLPGMFGFGGGGGGATAPATFNGTGPLMSFAGSGGGGGFGGIVDAIMKGFSSIAAFENGTGGKSIPRTGLAILHKGEQVIPSNQVKSMNNNYGGHTINQSIVIQGNANDPERLKRSIGEGARNALASFNSAKRYA